jgi:acyl-CoA reductase-like NAD-dependent aldehyde dehydrogenase
MLIFNGMEIQNIIQNQRIFFHTGKTRDVKYRRTALKKLKDIVFKYEDECLDALNLDLGKSRTEAYLTEFILIRDELKLTLKSIKKWSRARPVPTPIQLAMATSYRQPEPYGLTLIVSPWNYPLALSIVPLIGAIAAGNTVVVKPSELAPTTSTIITKIIKEAFDEKHIVSVEGGIDVANELLEHRYDYIFFTGGTAVGQIYYEAAAKHLTPVTLELGGKSPCIVDSNINISETARRIVFGKFLNCGQSCTAPDYILVHQSIKDKLIKWMIHHIEKMYGDLKAEDSEYPLIVNERHTERIASLIDKSKVIYGGEVDVDKRYISPTILDNITMDDDIMKEEIFGPLLPIIIINNMDDTINFIQNFEKPLALYVFSKNQKLINKLLSSISFGGACVNDTMTHYVNPNLPFGGVGQSGIGEYHGKFSFDTFSHFKSVFKKSMWIDFSGLIRFAPWRNKFNFIKKIL